MLELMHIKLDKFLMCAGEVTAIDCLMDDGSQSPFPVLQCRNVYVLPGVPHLLRKKWLVSFTTQDLFAVKSGSVEHAQLFCLSVAEPHP